MVAEGCLLAALARECFVVAVVIFERGTVGAHQHFGCVAVCAVCVFLVWFRVAGKMFAVIAVCVLLLCIGYIYSAEAVFLLDLQVMRRVAYIIIYSRGRRSRTK